MPTPSAPSPQPPYAFTSTCPDTDEQHDDASMSTAIRRSAVAGRDAVATSAPPSPPSHLDASDGPVSDSHAHAHAHAHSPALDSRPRLDSHKIQDSEDDRTESSLDSSPPHSIQSSTPRHGVGTCHRSADRMDVDVNASKSRSRDPRVQDGVEQEFDIPSMGHGYPSRRIVPVTPSSYLRAGTRFAGNQQSERQVYAVQVEIKYVDLRESFLCGYLRIQGLTDDHPTLTTYFEGEIIGTKYGFFTKHDSWGANDKTDLSHWSKFQAFRPYQKQARRGSSVFIKDVAQSEHIFMRWKEHFLVPDHRVRTITGASFEGFYYICFNQRKGEVNGIYFHSKSERFQQLELKHVEDRGCHSALEFR